MEQKLLLRCDLIHNNNFELGHTVVLLKSDLDVHQTTLRGLRWELALSSNLRCDQIHNQCWSHFVVLLKSDLDVQQTGLSLLSSKSELWSHLILT